MQSRLRNAVMALILAAAATGASAQSIDPAGMGTWKLNVAKSKYSPGPAPKSLTAKFEPAGKSVKATTEGVGADGKPTATEYTTNFDGKDIPLTGSPLANMTNVRRVDANTTIRTDKKDGKVIQTLTRQVAKDGKTFTVTVKGVNAKGEPIDHMLLFEKS